MKKGPLIYDRAMHEARKYWRDRLESISFDGHVALDHPRPKDGKPRLTSAEREFDADVHALLHRLTGDNRFLSYTALIAALKICCSKFSGRSNVTVFVPTALGDADANLLPISSTLGGQQSFKDTLLATKELLSDAYNYQQYPFSRILMDIPDARRPAHLAMVAAMVDFSATVADGSSDVSVVFETDEASTKATVRFDSRLFENATIAQFFQLLNAILRRCLRDMAVPIADLCRDDGKSADDGARDNSEETSKIRSTLAAVGIAEVRQHGDGELHRLIEARALAHPERTAIVEGDRITTYGMLNQYADRLALALASLPLDRRKPVAIALEASTELVVCMFAASKIGLAFAPIEPLLGSPGAGLSAATLDCECVLCWRDSVAVKLEHSGGMLAGVKYVVGIACPDWAGGSDVPTLEVELRDIAPTDIGAGGDVSARPNAVLGKQNGRTGALHIDACCVFGVGQGADTPKSEVNESELVSLLQWLNRRYGTDEHDRSIMVPGCGACEQLFNTFGMLIAGASVEIPERSTPREERPVAELLLSAGATIWAIPTALMQNTLASLVALRGAGAERRRTRAILLVGEKQCCSLAGKLGQCFPNSQITGFYAPANAGLWTTYFPLNEPACAAGQGVVAQAIPGFEHLVLNENGEPAPPQTKGKLHVRPLSACTRPTGLRARRLSGDRIAWLRGAAHCFFKAGCWVELTEIEATLCQHEHILAAEVIAVTTDGEPASTVLAAVLADPTLVSAEGAQNVLALREGVDLVPDRFVVMDHFPLTIVGAIDDDALFRLCVGDQGANGARNREADSIHRRLKPIWLEILQLENVEDDDSFFASGGNSLKATLLMARIKDEFSVDVSVLDFFRKPTTRAVAQLIATQSASARSSQRGLDLKPVSRERYRVQLIEGDGAASALPS